MHLRISTKRQGKKTYRYAQIVKSYRRPDGVPAHKIVASLGHLPENEIENLRLALKASREGKALLLPEVSIAEDLHIRILSNLQYLDVAVALETWRRWGLSRILNRLAPQGLEAVAPSLVIAALVIQRCTDPGSKFYAQRWFPRTALPELLDIQPEQFNNSRIHRTLDYLDRIDDALQTELPKRYQQREGVFATLFMDVSDAWFEGRGPELAERSRTKEGLRNHRKVGIVLVCNERGYPLRWNVTPGRRRDPQCLEEMLFLIQDKGWIGEAPLVCDRAMGKVTSVYKLVTSGVRFLTATSRPEIASYTDAIPYEPFLALQPVGSKIILKSEIATAAQTAIEAGLQKVDDLLYVLELGVSERMLTFEKPVAKYSGATWDPDSLTGGASFIALARIFREKIRCKEVRSQSELSQVEGVTRARITQIMNTLKIDEKLQEQVLLGDFGYVPERLLRDCVRYKSEKEQRRLLEEHAQRGRSASNTDRTRIRPRRTGQQKARLRLVAYFNPQMFVEQRSFLSRRRQKIEDYVADLNRRIASPHCRRDKESIRVEVHNELAKLSMIKVYEVHIRTTRNKDSGKKCPHVRLTFNEEEWNRRRRYAGFVLLVGHPELPHSAEDIVKLYRKKDTVEKDFQTIKDVVKLRPVYHHTDPKVRAHVTLCMLALLLERSIERHLKTSKVAQSATACFEELRSCHLNLVCSDVIVSPAYMATEPNQAQRAILRSLRMKALLDPEELSERLHPRQNQ